ncbi:MAG: hypothetical protein HYY84_15560 [Deltaproteobacteria bacterium]|nr:hypothetical protein [Deltaproteobacteria bacterium]
MKTRPGKHWLKRRCRWFIASIVLFAACGGDGASAPGGSNTSSPPSSNRPGKGKTGDDCQRLSDCDESTEDTCLKVGSTGFCTHSCTRDSQCPSGFECNISPYTACVPKR